MAPVNQCSPVPALVSMFEAYGTLTDRDYVITKSGQQQSTTFSVVPMDKAKFRNEKAKPLSEQKFLQLLDKAFPCDTGDDEDEPKRRAPKSKGNKKDEPDDEWEDVEEDEDNDYSSMTAKELYSLCKEREIDVKPKKSSSYYIDKLEEYDSQSDDDEWEDEEEDEWDE